MVLTKLKQMITRMVQTIGSIVLNPHARPDNTILCIIGMGLLHAHAVFYAHLRHIFVEKK